jgi:Tol biopolymer transport system component
MSLDDAIRRSLHRRAAGVQVDPDAWTHLSERRPGRRPVVEPRARTRVAVIAVALLVPALLTYGLIARFGARTAAHPPSRPAASIVGATPGSQGELLYAKNDGLSWSLYVLDTATGIERRITDGAVRDYASDWSPDGTKVVFDREVDDMDSGGIWVADADGSDPVQLVANGRFPAWSPDGGTIAYMRPDPGPEHGHASSIWLIGTDGSRPRPLTSDNVDFCPVWSPDGTEIAFLRHGVGLMVVGEDGSGAHEIAGPELFGSFGTPDWSPDGTTIVSALGPKEGGAPGGVALLATDGSGNMTFVPGTQVDFPDYVANPTWSPDGRWIAYVRGASGPIVIVHPDGSDARTIQVDPGDDSVEQLHWGVASDLLVNASPSPEASPSPLASSSGAPSSTGSGVAVLNGTSQIGLASSFSERLDEDGYHVVGEPADAPTKPVDVTVVYYAAGDEMSANADLAQRIADEYFTGRIDELPPFLADVVGEGVPVVVVMGPDAPP